MQLEIGQEVDGYLIQSIIGRGGMGIVYKAEDVALSRQVALKVINPSMSRDEAFVRRFQSEARTLAVINSPHIVAIHAFRKTEQGLFIVMEFVDGGDLSDLLQEGKLSVVQTTPIISQLLRAFQVAHSAGVVHRDIKPPNIMISKSNEVKVTDFGLAKMNQAGTTKSMTQGVIGTLYYMSPEQIRGEEVDQRTDLWSLGVVFYEMLTGVRPFDAAYEASVMYAIMNEPMTFPERLQNDLPEEIQRIVTRALEKDRDKRYLDATEMLVDLEEFEASYVDMTATRVMPGSSVKRKTQRNKKQARTSSPATTSGKTRTAPAADAWKPGIPKIGNKKSILIAGGAALIAVIGIALYLILGGPDPLPPPTISLNSEPDKASVYVDGNFIGKTPLADFEIEGAGDSVPVRIEFMGFASLDTLLKTRVMHYVELTAEEQAVAQTSDGDDDETTPVVNPPPPPAVPGAVVLQAFPAGEAYIDGQRVPSRESYSLPAGRYAIRFVSPVYGSTETTIRIASRETRDIRVYFESDITISTRPSSIVFIDDNLVGETPYVGKLGPGTYRIRVEKEGYLSSPADTSITIEPAFDQPVRNRLSFTLDQQ